MNIQIRQSFARDLEKLGDKDLFNRVKQVIEDVERANKLSEITNLKKMKDWKNYYRIKIGNFRIGLVIDKNVVTFVRFLHRKEIYRYFP